MKRTTLTLVRSLALTASILLGAGAAFAQVVTFDELSLSTETYWNGPDETVTPETVTSWGDSGTAHVGSFMSGGVRFANTHTVWENYTPTNTADDYSSWNGWSYSNMTDTTTAGIDNQYSAYVLPGGGGHTGSPNYAVYYEGFDVETTVTGVPAGALRGAYVTNTTYAALSMLNGDSYAKKFGGASGDDQDWFLLTITGLDASDQSTGTVDFYLADYRFTNNADDYIVSDWTWVDLSSLGDATQLQFAFSSSDTGSWGMNTPAYFAMDSLTLGAVPEPSASLLLLCAGLVGLTSLRRRGPRGR